MPCEAIRRACRKVRCREGKPTKDAEVEERPGKEKAVDLAEKQSLPGINIASDREVDTANLGAIDKQGEAAAMLEATHPQRAQDSGVEAQQLVLKNVLGKHRAVGHAQRQRSQAGAGAEAEPDIRTGQGVHVQHKRGLGQGWAARSGLGDKHKLKVAVHRCGKVCWEAQHPSRQRPVCRRRCGCPHNIADRQRACVVVHKHHSS